MIYTIGYQALTPARLKEIVIGLDATLVDVRSLPRSRKRGFSKLGLASLLAERYTAQGDHLGGRGGVTGAGLAWIEARNRQGGTLVLMCVEEAPGDCHRHCDICSKHFPHAMHIYRDELMTAKALDRAIAADSDYILSGSLDELMTDTANRGKLLA